MGDLNIFEWIKKFIGGIGWRLFIWSYDGTENDYWNAMYEHEKKYREEKVRRDKFVDCWPSK